MHSTEKISIITIITQRLCIYDSDYPMWLLWLLLNYLHRIQMLSDLWITRKSPNGIRNVNQNIKRFNHLKLYLIEMYPTNYACYLYISSDMHLNYFQITSILYVWLWNYTVADTVFFGGRENYSIAIEIGFVSINFDPDSNESVLIVVEWC
jgi:hypothetical protein